jgi:small ligand-binding sensory domain FIST
VTNAEGQRIRRLGGRSPVQALEDLEASLSPAEQRLVDHFGLYLGRVVNEYKSRFGRGDFLVRDVLKVDERQDALTVDDPQLAVGQTVQFHVLDPECVRADLELLLEAERLKSPPLGTMLFSCPRRGLACEAPAAEDAQRVSQALGPQPLIAFETGGQIGPGVCSSDVHVGAASLLVFREPTGPRPPEPAA